MMTQGLVLMGIGMGMVFIFLIVMILVMNIEAALMKPLAKILPEPEEKVVVKAKKTIVSENHEDVAVAIAAIRSFSK